MSGGSFLRFGVFGSFVDVSVFFVMFCVVWWFKRVRVFCVAQVSFCF